LSAAFWGPFVSFWRFCQKSFRLGRGRCYDHNFLRFLPLFGAKKFAFFSKTNGMIEFFCKNLLQFEQKTPIFSLNISAKIFLKTIHRPQVFRCRQKYFQCDYP
jgi:hypothetical protein